MQQLGKDALVCKHKYIFGAFSIQTIVQSEHSVFADREQLISTYSRDRPGDFNRVIPLDGDTTTGDGYLPLVLRCSVEAGDRKAGGVAACAGQLTTGVTRGQGFFL